MLGGMSWESSAECYRLANALVRQRLGGLHSARCVLVSVDVADIEPRQVNRAWDEAGARLARAAAQVEAAGADLLLLCTNTMHKVAEHVADAVRIPLLHIVDATAAAVRGAGVRTVGLLGTAFTVEQDCYRDRLASHGLTVIVPEAADWAVVHTVIYDEFGRRCRLRGVREGVRRGHRPSRRRRGAGRRAGCTEIELLIGPDDSPVPVFPTTRIHVEAAVDRASPRADQPAASTLLGLLVNNRRRSCCGTAKRYRRRWRSRRRCRTR